MGGSILGMGADLIVVDDPIKPADALSAKERQRVNDTFHSTVMTRLNNKVGGAIVIIMQRLHEDDLVGNLLQTGDWDHVSIPAIAVDDGEFRTGTGVQNIYCRARGEVLHPQREPMHILESLKRSQGTLTFSAQYQQNPMPVAGNIVKRDWLRYHDEPPKTFDKVVTSWDTASTLGEASDFSVGTTWGLKGLDFYLLEVVRGKYEFGDLKRQVTDLASRWNANQTIIENTGLGLALVQEMRRTKHWCRFLAHPNWTKPQDSSLSQPDLSQVKSSCPEMHRGWVTG